MGTPGDSNDEEKNEVKCAKLDGWFRWIDVSSGSARDISNPNGGEQFRRIITLVTSNTTVATFLFFVHRAQNVPISIQSSPCIVNPTQLTP